MKPTSFILCADCGQETPMDRLFPSFGLCPACEVKHQQRVFSLPDQQKDFCES